MCEECQRLEGEVVKLEREYEHAERQPEADGELLDAVGEDLTEARRDLKAHTDSCEDALDDWEYHKAAAAAGQITLLGGGA